MRPFRLCLNKARVFLLLAGLLSGLLAELLFGRVRFR